jgi:hypothetical protein
MWLHYLQSAADVTVVGTEVSFSGGSKILSTAEVVMTVGLLDDDSNKIKTDERLACC